MPLVDTLEKPAPLLPGPRNAAGATVREGRGELMLPSVVYINSSSNYL